MMALDRKYLLWALVYALVGMCLGLFLLYGGILPASQLEPILGVASLPVLLGALLMLVLVVKASTMPRRLVR